MEYLMLQFLDRAGDGEHIKLLRGIVCSHVFMGTEPVAHNTHTHTTFQTVRLGKYWPAERKKQEKSVNGA